MRISDPFSFAPEDCHGMLLDRLPRALGLPYFRHLLDNAGAFDDATALFAAWRSVSRSKLKSLLQGDWYEREQGAPAVEIVFEHEERLEDGTEFREIRFVFEAEPGANVPCHLLLPLAPMPARPPVAICLQGHSSGMHISLGRPQRKGDPEIIFEGDRDFALQAVRRGWAALTLEMRGFGEREPRPPFGRAGSDPRCQHASATALLLGRTLVGERCYDVSRAIDTLESAFSERVDTSRILCMGNSGGGTVTYYAACLDERITAVMPSCSVCTYRDSIGSIHHCIDNYVPGIGQWFEMGDLAALIAPRPLVIAAGNEDTIFPLQGVEEAYATIRDIYVAAGAPERCRLVVGDGGHRFYADAAWKALGSMAA